MSTERSPFDESFQRGVLKLALQDDYYCAQLVKYLGDLDKDPQTKKKFVVFHTTELQVVFDKICAAYNELGERPTEEHIRQMIYTEPEKSKKGEGADRDLLYATLDRILEVDLRNDQVYKESMDTYIKRVKFMTGQKVVKDLWSKDFEKATGKMQSMLDDINKVSFEKEDTVTMDDVERFLDEAQATMGKAIPTGIEQLDSDLHGGLLREQLVTVLAGTNVGKSMFCVSLGCNALRAVDQDGVNEGHKILYIALEGMRSETILRFTSNLAKVEYGKMIQGQLNDEEKARIKESVEQYRDRILVRNMLDFNNSIEKLMAEVNEIYKDFPFSMCIIDYGQLLTTQMPSESHRFTLATVYRGLAAMSRKFNCVLISPVQATRQGQENQSVTMDRNRSNEQAPVLRSSDISEAFEIARVSGVIMSLNMTDDERHEGKLRVFLEKQRHGKKGNQYGILTDFPHCDLITKHTYNPNSDTVMGEGEFGVDEKNESFDLSFAMGNNLSIDQKAFIEKMDSLIDPIFDLEKEIKNGEEELKTIRDESPLEIDDPEGDYQTYKQKLQEKEYSLKDCVDEFKKLFKAIHDVYTSEHHDLVDKNYENIKANKKDDEPEYIQASKLKARYDMFKKIKEQESE